MKNILFVLAWILASGCACLPENGEEHDEHVVFRHALVADSHVASILAHKPNADIYILGDSHDVIIYVNQSEVVWDENGKKVEGPGNMYTPLELKTIEKAAIKLRAKIGIKRHIVIYDESADREWRVKDNERATALGKTSN